jgi:hypothetical protein
MVESLNIDALTDKLAVVYDDSKKLCDEETAWEEYYSHGKLIAYKRLLDGRMCIKVVVFIDKPAEAVSNYFFTTLSQNSLRLQPDLIDKSEIATTWGDDALLLHDQSKPLGPVSPREIWLFAARSPLGDEGAHAISGFTPEGLPTADGFVQADVKFFLYLFEPLHDNPSKSKLTTTSLIDPRGSLPSVVVNNVAEKRAYYFRDLAALAEQEL